jgi:tricorn protease
LFDEKSPFTVKSVIPNGPADKEEKDILPGDELIRVNGKASDKKNNRESYFLQPSMDPEMKLTFQRGTRTFDVLLHPVSSGTVSNLLYDQWIAQNQAMVDSLSDRKVAYVYMKNMSGNALADFYKEMTSEAYQRQALILDLRYNTGGNVHDEVLRFLRRKAYLQWKYREGQLAPQSNFSPADKPMVLLINEQTLSDGEMSATGWKALELGPVIGTETYRWIIFTSGKALVDGSFYRLPSWGCYTLEGDDLEQTGVAPTIPVEMNFKHRQEGEDPQLQRAIEEVMRK